MQSKHPNTESIVHIVQVKSTNHCTTSHHCTSTDRSQRTSHTSTHTTVRCVDELIHSKHTNNAMYNAFLTSQTYSMRSAHWRDHKTHQIPHTLMNTRQHVVTVAFCQNSTKANHINDLQWQLLLYNALVQSKVQVVHNANYINVFKSNMATDNYIS